MKWRLLGVLVVVVTLGTAVGSLSVELFAQSAPAAKTDAQIKDEIVRLSIASYSGSCPCPFNRDRAGRSCGRRSAYSRPGGAASLCYAEDVTAKMVADHRAKNEKRPPVVPAGRAGGTSSRQR
jgi:hypothetical protein